MNISNTFRAFKNRNYRLFFIGQFISRIGLWTQRTAVIWVIYTLTHSIFMIGVTTFAEQFPSFLFSLWGGIVSDRYDRYKILLITQIASMVQAVLLAILIFTKHYAVWEMLVLSVVLGIINAFDVPARQPMVHQLVNDEADLSNAVALNSSLTTLAAMIGPALSGILLQKLGAGVCFLVNAVSFIAIIACLLMMKLPPYKPSTRKRKLGAELSEGYNYLKRNSFLSHVILLLGLASLFVLCYQTLIPVFAKAIFSGNAAVFGYISSFIGAGALIGAIFLASLKKESNLKVVLLVNTIILGVALICFSFTRSYPLACVVAIPVGFGAMSIATICITIIQVNSDKTMRGRIMSYVAMAFFGMLPVGSLLVGAVSERIGAPAAMLFEGIIALVIVASFARFLLGNQLNVKQAAQPTQV